MAALLYRFLRGPFRMLVPERYRQFFYDLLTASHNFVAKYRPSAIRTRRWRNHVFIPFDTGQRERFFLSAAGFLWTNRDDRLKYGYYMEFGCFGAVTMRLAWKHTRHFFEMKYLAFDSFAGLPEIDEIDNQPIWQKGRLAMDEFEFARLTRKAGMPESRLKTIKGFYDESLTTELQDRLLPTKAAIIYVDCDLYKSTVPVLNFIPPFLQVGAIVALDDWNCFWADPERGQRRAWREFTEAHPHLAFEPFISTHGLMSFVCTKV